MGGMKNIKFVNKLLSQMFSSKMLSKKQEVLLGENVKIADTEFKGKNRISDNCILKNSSIGYGTYIGELGRIYNVCIGKYTSIGAELRIVRGSHPIYDCISSSPFFYSQKYGGGFSYVKKEKYYPYNNIKNKYNVVIGNDVWIGDRVSILDGVSIGDGSVIGAGSVVTKNTEPYGIYVGNPAKLIKKRFSDDEISKLIAFSWWNKSERWIIENADLFMDKDNFLDRM